MTTIATGKLNRDHTGHTTIGPADYRLEWWRNTDANLVVRVWYDQRIVGNGVLVRGSRGIFEGEVSAEGVRYWIKGKQDDETLTLEWSCPRLPLHKRKTAPAWSLAFVGPAPEVAE